MVAITLFITYFHSLSTDPRFSSELCISPYDVFLVPLTDMPRRVVHILPTLTLVLCERESQAAVSIEALWNDIHVFDRVCADAQIGSVLPRGLRPRCRKLYDTPDTS